MPIVRKVMHSDLADVSKLLIDDLSRKDGRFSEEFIAKLKEHAKIKSLENELKKRSIIWLAYFDRGVLKGFIVGYRRKGVCHLDYVSGKSDGIKKRLVGSLENRCRKLGIFSIRTEAYEHMENNRLYRSLEFNQISEKKVNNSLTIVKYMKKL